MKVFLFLLLIYPCLLISQPTWTVYPANVMYTGQYKAFLSPKSTGILATVTQTMYRTDVSVANYFTAIPKVILSLLGYKQNAPPDGITSVGFDAKISTIRIPSFDVDHIIYGAGMGYLSYMYLAVAPTNTDFFLGQYNQAFDITIVNKSYSIDIAYNSGENYPNYPTNKIQMKGFLAGYKMKQGTATGVSLNFTLKTKDASQFTIQVSVDINSMIQNIWFYRIGYDRTAIQRKSNNDIFRDFSFKLENNVNTLNIYNASFATQIEFQYRNFIMGTNKINIGGTVPMAVEFFLYYYFASSLFTVDVTAPAYIDNPATAKYLYGEVFYHTIKSCASSNPDLYYQTSDRKCYSSCPTLGFSLDTTSATCLACHFTCRTCNAGFLANKCLSCDTNYRNYDSTTNRCNCLPQQYDDGISLSCPLCDTRCLNCVSLTKNDCKTCNSTLKRQLYDSNFDGIGQCICLPTFYQNTTTNTCLSCSQGCLKCSFSGSVESCLSCDLLNHFQLNISNCVCSANYSLVNQSCSLEQCGNGVLTRSQECDDNNIMNGDGCSSQCKVEPDHACFQNATLSNYSICYFNGTISMTITDVSKSPYSNEVSLSIKIDTDANSQFLKKYLTNSPSITLQDIARRLQQLIIEPNSDKKTYIRNLASSSLTINSIKYDDAAKMLFITFSYSQSFDIKTKKIKFQPSMAATESQTKYFYNSPEAIVQLEKTYNKIDTKYYDLSEYNQALSFKYSFLALVTCLWIASLAFLIIGKGNVAMQMMIVCQLAYVSLLSQQKVQIMMGGLSQFGKYTAGYNIQFLKSTQKCKNFVAIQMNCSLVNNLNITFIVIISLIVIYWCLRLMNRILNYRAEKIFIENNHKKYMMKNNQRTDENINPNADQIARKSEFSVSQCSQALQQNYYKDQQFIPQKVYCFLLDLLYFLAFATVIVWVLSMCFIKQYTISSIIQATLFAVTYLLLWIFWFMKYSTLNISFVQAHKQTSTQYEQQQQPSQTGENQINIKPISKQKVVKQTKKLKFSTVFFKTIFYPLVWLALLGIGVVLGLTDAIGYVAQSLIIAGSIIIALIIWFTKIYKQKLHILRAILNCLVLVIIQILYIISQVDSVIGSGLPIAIAVFILLCLVVISNTVSTFYLYKVQLKLIKKKQESKQVQNIQIEIDRLEKLKKQKQNFNGALYFITNDNKSSLQSSSLPKTINKNQQYHLNHNIVMNGMSEKKFSTQQKYKLTKQQINQMLTQNKLYKSKSFASQVKKQNMLQGFQRENLSQSRNQFITQKKKLFSPIKIGNFSYGKSQIKGDVNPSISETHIKIGFQQNKY